MALTSGAAGLIASPAAGQQETSRQEEAGGQQETSGQQEAISFKITAGKRRALPLAVTQLQADDLRIAGVARDLPLLIRNNLGKTGDLKIVSGDLYPQTAGEILNGLDFDAWTAGEPRALLTGNLSLLPDGRMQANIWLYDLLKRSQYFALSYSATPETWRRIGHIISDEVYRHLTNEKGMFDSRIVYVSESGPATRRIKRLAIMDQDGGNHRFLTEGSKLVLTPRFSPVRQEITFISYEGGRPAVKLMNLNTGQVENLGDFAGRSMTFSPRFSPDGQSVIMSLAAGGNTDVYVMNLETRSVARLTDNPAIDTSPSFSPDGKRIVFNSDRGGSQQLYVMNADGTDVQRISFGAGSYATPVWSPKANGNLIAFTRIQGDTFAVGTMKSDGSLERIISSGFLVEGPEWSPNGRMLTYYKQEASASDELAGRTRLFVADTITYTERELVTPSDASDPAWSPLLPR